ncbi:MAG: NAD-dependent epimerase/dehydratase family protein [candidate division FCPU426 bacterium]
MQTILGSSGAIGTSLAKSLTAYTKEIRLVSRNPKKVNATDDLLSADLTNREQVFFAVRGSEVVYLTVGLPYRAEAWERLWPALMQNVIDACIEHRTRLVFFDNTYAIGENHVRHITEDSPLSPTSRKGQARAQVDRMLIEKIEKGRLLAVIARSPDFFGPIKVNSALMAMVYDNLAKGQKAMWLCNARVPHSVGYTPELAMATAKLGNTSSAFNQIWNLPTAPPLTGEEWVRLFAAELNAKPRVQVLPGWGIKLLGLFVPILREMDEMKYQYDRPCFFDSAKYEQTFKYAPVSSGQAVRETVEALKQAQP